jgi:hypothetical protein
MDLKRLDDWIDQTTRDSCFYTLDQEVLTTYLGMRKRKSGTGSFRVIYMADVTEFGVLYGDDQQPMASARLIASNMGYQRWRKAQEKKTN